MRLEIHYYNMIRQVTGKASETVEFIQPMTVKQWLVWFIGKYQEGIKSLYQEIDAETLFRNSTLFVQKQVVFNMNELLDTDLKLYFFLAISGG